MSTSGNKGLSTTEKVTLLKSLGIFSETPETILSELAPLMQEEEIGHGALIFREGEPGDCMYIIFSGEIEIHKGRATLAILQAREVFGELSLLDAETRSATATACCPWFGIVIGIMIYLACSFFFYILASNDRKSISPYWFLTYIFETIKNILFAIGILMYSRNKLSEKQQHSSSLPYLDMI